jgi:hypothetical protein
MKLLIDWALIRLDSIDCSGPSARIGRPGQAPGPPRRPRGRRTDLAGLLELRRALGLPTAARRAPAEIHLPRLARGSRERPLPEEINELAHPATPLGLTEAMSAVLYDVGPSLDRARVEFRRDGILIALGYELIQDGLLDLGRLVGPAATLSPDSTLAVAS